MVDLHAHILPGLDDGPLDLDAAVEMARAAVDAGTAVLAATSHVNRTFGLTPEDLARGRAALRARLHEERITLDVVQGGEVSTGRLPDLTDEDLRGVVLGSGPWVLLECPFGHASAMDLMIADLQRRGFGVLLAHPERSASFQRDPARLGRLLTKGALAQVTAGSFAGDFGEVPRRAAFAMLEAGWIHVLATDAHDVRGRPPALDRAVAPLQHRYGNVDELIASMTTTVPAALLAGLRPPPIPPVPRPRTLGGWLRGASSRR